MIAVLKFALTKLTIGMHYDVYEWIWLRLGMMRDITEIHILIGYDSDFGLRSRPQV